MTAREIQRHADDDVFVNIATGSKISAIGGMIARTVTDAVLYYVEPERCGEKDAQRVKPVSHGVKKIKKLPAYPIDAPEAQLIYAMEYIYRNGSVTKKELIEFGEGTVNQFKQELYRRDCPSLLIMRLIQTEPATDYSKGTY